MIDLCFWICIMDLVVFDPYSFPYIFPMQDVQWRTCELCMNMLHVVLDEAERLHHKVIVGENFHIELHLGHSGNSL